LVANDAAGFFEQCSRNGRVYYGGYEGQFRQQTQTHGRGVGRYSLPAQYLVMVEFESLAAAQGGMPHVHVKPEILFIHGPKVFNNCIRAPSVYLSDSMFAEHTYREILQGH